MREGIISQTNSCPSCAIEMQLFENGKLKKNYTNIDYIVDLWKAEKIVALKGIGGYLLTCDATNANAIKLLRERKKRPTKPFAVMYPNCNMVAQEMDLSTDEKTSLESITAPIVLLSPKHASDQNNQLALNEINHSLSRVGVMLPYTPLYELLLHKFKKPIIATSGNITNSTIVFEDQKAMDELSKIADIILLNNREIMIPQDDSVVQFSKIHQQKITLRRSRGKAPSYINTKLKSPEKNRFCSRRSIEKVYSAYLIWVIRISVSI